MAERPFRTCRFHFQRIGKPRCTHFYETPGKLFWQKKRKRAPASERTPPSVKFDSRQSIKILLQKVGTRLHGGAAYTSNWRVQAALANGNLRGFRRIKFESSTEGPSLSTCVSLHVSLGKTPFALLAHREIKLSRLCDVVSRTAMVAQDLVGTKTANMYS